MSFIFLFDHINEMLEYKEESINHIRKGDSDIFYNLDELALLISTS